MNMPLTRRLLLTFTVVGLVPARAFAAMTDVRNIGELRTLKTQADTCVVGGYETPGDGGGGTFVVTAGHDALPDDGGTLIVDDQGRRWKRLYSGPLQVAWFGTKGDGVSNDTAAEARAWAALSALCALGAPAQLQYGPGTYRSAAPRQAPDASDWQVTGIGMPTLLMSTDNTEQILFAPTAPRRGFKLERFIFAWSKDQPAENKKAIGFAFRPPAPIPNGVYNFEFTSLIGTNGNRLISIHPDVIDAGFNFPTWGARLDQITSYREMSGATISLGNFGLGGAPRIIIDNFYAQSQGAKEPVIILSQMSSVAGRNWEFNLGVGRQFHIASCTQTHLENVRFEHCTLSENEQDLCSISGGRSAALIQGFEIQSLKIDASGSVYGLDCFGTSARVEDITMDGVVETSTGSLTILHPRNGGAIQLGGSNHLKATMHRSNGRSRLVDPRDAKNVSGSSSSSS